MCSVTCARNYFLCKQNRRQLSSIEAKPKDVWIRSASPSKESMMILTLSQIHIGKALEGLREGDAT